MPKFDVIIRGAKGYFETGQYETAFRKGAYYASKDILDDLQDKGYIRLSHPDGSWSVIFKEAVMSFSVNTIKEEEK